MIPFTLIAFGETRITSGPASLLNATTPIFTVLVAHGATADEKFSRGKVAGVLFGFAGIALLVDPGSGEDSGLVGEIACLLAFTYGFASVYGRRFRGVPPLHVATAQVTAPARGP